MADMCGQISQQAAECNGMNYKAIVDRFVSLMQSGAEDNQSNKRGWDALNLSIATDAQIYKQTILNDAQKVKHLAELGLLQAGQTGFTENQQTVSPAGVAASEVTKAGVAVAGEQVAANVAALSDIGVKLAEALIPAIVEAVKGVVATAPPTTAANNNGK